mgnify:CR=1 FL=1
MADNLTLSSVVEGITRTQTVALTPGETTIVKAIIGSGGVEATISLGGITKPRMVAVFGGVGVVFRLAATGAGVTAIAADPFGVVVNDVVDGFTQSNIYITNAGAQPCTCTIIATE